MKALLLVLIFAAVATASIHEPSHHQFKHFDKFVKFVQEFKKDYPIHEFGLRMRIFHDNYEFIEKHNAEAAQGKHSYTLGINQFTDLTQEEFRKGYLNYKRTDPSDSMFAIEAEPFVPSISVEDAPDFVDWREKNVVTEVKNQGQCGSCWSFSAVGAMEGAHALATGKLVSFSEQELVDCVNDGANTCEVGGLMQDGFKYVIAAGGIETESAYPYTATSGNQCRFDADKSVATFSSFSNVTSGDEIALMLAVAERPTVSIAIDASALAFQLYNGGVFDHPSCKNIEKELDHGVLIVGYGTDAKTGKDYWIVKNSWGNSWGLDGYILMSRNKNNQCGVATDASFPIV